MIPKPQKLQTVSPSSSRYSRESSRSHLWQRRRPSLLNNIVVCTTPTHKKIPHRFASSPVTVVFKNPAKPPQSAVAFTENSFTEDTVLEIYQNSPQPNLPNRSTWLLSASWRSQILKSYYQESHECLSPTWNYRSETCYESADNQSNSLFDDWDDANDRLCLVFDGVRTRPRSLKLEQSFFLVPNLILEHVQYYNKFQAKKDSLGIDSIKVKSKETEEKGIEEKGIEEKGIEEKGIEEKGIEEKGIEEKETEKKGIEEKGIEEKGIEEKGIGKTEIEKESSEMTTEKSSIIDNSHNNQNRLLISNREYSCSTGCSDCSKTNSYIGTIYESHWPNKTTEGPDVVKPLEKNTNTKRKISEIAQVSPAYYNPYKSSSSNAVENVNPYATSLWQTICPARGIDSHVEETSDKAKSPMKAKNEDMSKKSVSTGTNEVVSKNEKKVDNVMNSNETNIFNEFYKFSVPSLDTFSSHYSNIKPTESRKLENKRVEMFKFTSYFPESSQLEKDETFLPIFDKCLLELFETELAYRDDLMIVVDIFMKTLKNQYRFILSEEQKITLFGNIEQILESCNLFIDSIIDGFKRQAEQIQHDAERERDNMPLLSLMSPVEESISLPDSLVEKLRTITHDTLDKEFLKELVKNFSRCSWSYIDVGGWLLDYFCDIKFGFYEKYSFYSSNYKQQNKLVMLKLNNSGEPDFQRWYNECTMISKTTSTTSWDLESLLIKPVQRLTKYKLLIGQLVEQQQKAGKDVDILKEALEAIESIADKINAGQPSSHGVKTVFQKISKHTKGSLFNHPMTLESAKDTDDQPTANKKSLNISDTNFLAQLPYFKTPSNASSDSGAENLFSMGSTASSMETSRTNGKNSAQTIETYNVKNSKLALIPAERIIFVNMILEFKHKYDYLLKLQAAVTEHMECLSNQVKKHLLITEAFQKALQNKGTGGALRRHDVAERQKVRTMALIVLLKNHILIKLKVCIAYCDSIRVLINEDRENRIRYLSYVASNQKKQQNNSNNIITQIVKKSNGTAGMKTKDDRLLDELVIIKHIAGHSQKAQRSIKLENMLRGDLPLCNKYLEEFIEQLSLKFLKIITDSWHNASLQ